MKIFTDDDTNSKLDVWFQEYEQPKMHTISHSLESDINEIREYRADVKKLFKLSVLGFIFSFCFFGIFIAKNNLKKFPQLRTPFVDPTNFFEVSLLRSLEKKRDLAERLSTLSIIPCCLSVLFIAFFLLCITFIFYKTPSLSLRGCFYIQ